MHYARGIVRDRRDYGAEERNASAFVLARTKSGPGPGERLTDTILVGAVALLVDRTFPGQRGI